MSLVVAELFGRARQCLLGGEPLRHEVVDAMRHMRVGLGLEILLFAM